MECRKGENGNILVSGSITADNAEEFQEGLLSFMRYWSLPGLPAVWM